MPIESRTARALSLSRPRQPESTSPTSSAITAQRVRTACAVRRRFQATSVARIGRSTAGGASHREAVPRVVTGGALPVTTRIARQRHPSSPVLARQTTPFEAIGA
ncbi:MAG: hypothetical protein MZV70_40680 [Desulfobacterales bacterium]|nr:hypothetical protein [Desulfobacterales bacterium]